MKFSQQLLDELTAHWGRPTRAHKVVAALHDELFRKGIAYEDYDDQVKEAHKLGLMVGRAEGQGKSRDYLLERFAAYIKGKRR